MKNSVEKELGDLDKYIDEKVEQKVKTVSNKWSGMSTKQKLDFVFVIVGISYFSLALLSTVRKMRSGGYTGGGE